MRDCAVYLFLTSACVYVSKFVTGVWTTITGNKVSAATDTRFIEVGVINERSKKKHNKIKTSKYSLLTFLPKNLSEQFRRIASFYFLIVTVIAIVIDSPVSPMTSIAPLAFMVTVTAVKQGYEDWLRHRADNVVNNQIVEIIHNGTVKEVHNKTISPGTLVRVRSGKPVPADIVLLCEAGEKGRCYVTTANLDGETNLKTLRVPTPLVRYTADILPKGMRLEVPHPVADLYTFYGKLEIPGADSVTLTTDNIMLRGSTVKNTEWAIGCAVYTGEETKLALNSKYGSNKFSSCEVAVNGFLIFFIFILTTEILLSFVLKLMFDRHHTGHEVYLGPAPSPMSINIVLQDMFSFLLLYYYMIPMSLYVTIELYKFIGALFIGWDKDLVCEETGRPAVANTSDLNEELGQIEVLFSDKTGTLTKNLMVFSACSINGKVYEERDNILYDNDPIRAPADLQQTDLKFFFTALALCHSVQISSDDMKKLSAKIVNSNLKNLFRRKRENDNKDIINGLINNNEPSNKIEYRASSPDEKALVEAAERFGVTYLGEDGDNLIVKVGSLTEMYERLHTIEFSSERKRMSVVIKDKDGKIWLFCKGAESSILPLCRDDDLIGITRTDIDIFAEEGLRTLAIAFREVPPEEYDKVVQSNKNIKFKNAELAMKQSQELYHGLENDLTLLGATAVKDCLQDDVADTIASLREAGIKVWVLTGDKVETAINVAQSCNHISNDDKKMYMINIDNEEHINVHMDDCQRIVNENRDDKLTLIVDGTSMAQVLDRPLAHTFADIALECSAVLCCRLSPIQKAQIVKLIKNNPRKPITAAIGDGANDISMIQEAHVGFGIFGKEGYQAARSADYGFTKFSMLKKIILVLGHWYYQRLATLIQYFFYKNLVFAKIMLYFQIQSGWSTQSIFDSMFLTFFNLIFTALPCIIHSVTEQSKKDTLLLSKPVLYSYNRKNRLMSWRRFSEWCISALYHSILIYLFTWLAIKYSVISTDGKTIDLWCYGAALFHMLVVVVNLKLWLETYYNTMVFMLCVVLSMLSFVAFNLLYSSFNSQIDGDVLGTYQRLLSSFAFWSLNVLIVIATLLPDYCMRAIRDRCWKRTPVKTSIPRDGTGNAAFVPDVTRF